MTLPAPSLREPSHRVSQRAPAYWRVHAAVAAVVMWLTAVALLVTVLLVPGGWWSVLLWVGVAVLAVAPVPWLTLAPRIRFDVHRWEVTDIAVHVRSGWLSRTDEIVPLSRVQTVDSAQGPLMRVFGLRTVTVQTASSAGTVAIACLDDAVAQEVVARLVAITAATPEDAT
ncbi:PH domain-containing protein [Nocardioides sp. CER19]|uniref:PH domain-containing protein n=1 Tax=Nocardioides sp. CER19 TaxID=3038538 RepID=UPI00244837FA|nr:PH domain-containing protein [Nocardioides sp. CER19]MDH2414968.1 PH domain-containing protein [Nocardioides sp. CER19]